MHQLLVITYKTYVLWYKYYFNPISSFPVFIMRFITRTAENEYLNNWKFYKFYKFNLIAGIWFEIN